MKQLLSVISILNFSFFSLSQTLNEEYATKLSSTLNYFEAYPVWVEMANKTLKRNKANWNYVRKAVEAASKTEQYDKALVWSEILINKNDTCSQDWLNYFDLLLINNKHNQLISAIDNALLQIPNSTKIQEWRKNAPIILKQLTVNSEFSIDNFRQNKKGEEFSAVPYKGKTLIVSNQRNTGFVNRNYARTGQFFTDLITVEDNVDISKDKLWKEIKRTNPHDGPISFSKDNKLAILTVNQKEVDEVDGIKFSRLKIKIYRKINEEWREEIFPYNNKTYSVGHGVLDQLGNLYFASDMPGGFGGVDIYKCTYTNGLWSEPLNLGAKVNTSRNEVFPFVSDNGTLYFSSNGWPGNGGLDVFYKDNDTSNPKHIGNPINSNADDFGIYVDENTGKGFLSSNRNMFKDEIYRISKPVYKIRAEIILTTCDNKPLGKKQIYVKDLKTGLEDTMTTDAKGKISIKTSIHSTYVFSYAGDELFDAIDIEKKFDIEGEFSINITLKYKTKYFKLMILDEYGENIIGAQLTYYSKGNSIKKLLTSDTTIIISKLEITDLDSIVGYMINYSDCKFILPKNEFCSADPILKMNFTKKQESEFIKLENIYYDFDLWNIRPEGKIELNKLIKYMKEHPDLRVELSSHTDSRASDYYNILLANRRSESCVKYIKKMGIPSDKIIAKGYGEKQLINKCADGVKCTEAEHQENRRTELKIKLN
jgi:outer membrane protein OmpA-like peptidoglycan-associated protein